MNTNFAQEKIALGNENELNRDGYNYFIACERSRNFKQYFG